MRMMGWWDEAGRTEDPAGPLTDHLDAAIDEFIAARDEDWSDDPAREELVRVHEEIAEAFLSASFVGVPDSPRPTLWRGQEELPWPRVARVPADESFQRQIRESVEVQVASGLVPLVSDATKRALELAHHVLTRPRHRAVTTFLARMGRCYVLGLAPECVLLCRTALEQAVARAVEARGVRTSSPEGRAPSTPERLAALRREGGLSAETLRRAEAVWDRSELALRGDPDAAEDVLETIAETSDALDELYRES